MKKKQGLASMAKAALSGATGTQGQVAKKAPSSTIRSGGSVSRPIKDATAKYVPNPAKVAADLKAKQAAQTGKPAFDPTAPHKTTVTPLPRIVDSPAPTGRSGLKNSKGVNVYGTGKVDPGNSIRPGGSMTPKTAPVSTQPRTGGQIGAITLTPAQIASRNPAPRVNNTATAIAPKNKGQAQSAMVHRRNTARKAAKGTKATSASSAFMMKKQKDRGLAK